MCDRIARHCQPSAARVMMPKVARLSCWIIAQVQVVIPRVGASVRRRSVQHNSVALVHKFALIARATVGASHPHICPLMQIVLRACALFIHQALACAKTIKTETSRCLVAVARGHQMSEREA